MTRKEYYQIHKEEIKRKRREFYHANKNNEEYKERRKLWGRTYRTIYKEEIKSKSKEYYITNRQSCLNKHKEYRDANKDAIRLSNKEYRQQNKEREKVRHAKYHAKPEIKERRSLQSKKLYELNREKRSLQIKNYNAKYYKTENGKAQRCKNSHNRRARVNKVGGSYSVQEWINLKQQFNFTCLLCRRSEPEIKLTVDHIIPVSLGGSNDISNIRPLCKPCNAKAYWQLRNKLVEQEQLRL
jgi:5-methylcytosine-specific restriction endonuclease McrA